MTYTERIISIAKRQIENARDDARQQMRIALHWMRDEPNEAQRAIAAMLWEIAPEAAAMVPTAPVDGFYVTSAAVQIVEAAKPTTTEKG